MSEAPINANSFSNIHHRYIPQSSNASHKLSRIPHNLKSPFWSTIEILLHKALCSDSDQYHYYHKHLNISLLSDQAAAWRRYQDYQNYNSTYLEMLRQRQEREPEGNNSNIEQVYHWYYYLSGLSCLQLLEKYVDSLGDEATNSVVRKYKL